MQFSEQRSPNQQNVLGPAAAFIRCVCLFVCGFSKGKCICSVKVKEVVTVLMPPRWQVQTWFEGGNWYRYLSKEWGWQAEAQDTSYRECDLICKLDKLHKLLFLHEWSEYGVRACVFQCLWRSDESCVESLLSCLYVASKDHTQVTRFCHKCFTCQAILSVWVSDFN